MHIPSLYGNTLLTVLFFQSFVSCPSQWSTPGKPHATLEVSHHCPDHRLPPHYAAPVSNRVSHFSKWLCPPKVLCLFGFPRAIVFIYSISYINSLSSLSFLSVFSHSTSLVPEWKLMIAIAMSYFHWNFPQDGDAAAVMISVSLCTLEMTHFHKGVSVAIVAKRPGLHRGCRGRKARKMGVGGCWRGTLSHVHQPFRGDLVIKESWKAINWDNYSSQRRLNGWLSKAVCHWMEINWWGECFKVSIWPPEVELLHVLSLSKQRGPFRDFPHSNHWAEASKRNISHLSIRSKDYEKKRPWRLLMTNNRVWVA